MLWEQLSEEYSNYINSQALLSRLHYISHAFRDFTLDYLQYPLKGIKPVSVSAAMKLFKKTNDKDRYSFVIFFLKERPTVLAQIVYFSLLTPFNDSLSSALKSIKPFTEDDLMYFCFSTFPATTIFQLNMTKYRVFLLLQAYLTCIYHFTVQILENHINFYLI